MDIKHIKISSLRKHFGQMLQDVFLFSGTIRGNIVLRDFVHNLRLHVENGEDFFCGSEGGLELVKLLRQRLDGVEELGDVEIEGHDRGENLSGIKITQIFNQEQRKMEEFLDKSSRLKKAKQDQIFVFSIFRPMVYMLYISSVLCLL